MTAALRVVHLSVVHRPDDPRISERECRTLARAGYEVTYLAPGATPGIDGFGVRHEALPTRSRSRRWLTARDIAAALRRLRPFVVHTHDSELLTLFPALRPFVPRLVHDFHEFLPEAVLTKEYIPTRWRPLVATLSDRGQRTLARCADGVVVAAADILTDLGSRPTLRLVAPNYPRLTHFDDAAPFPEIVADPRLRLAYIGALSRSRGIPAILDVMERLERDDALLVLGGIFSSRQFEAETLARLESLTDRVLFLGRVARDDVPRYLASADVLWTASTPSAQFTRPTVATKIFEGAAVGLAVLASDLPGREIVTDEGFGIVVAPTVAGHLEGVRRLAADREAVHAMGRRARAAVRERYSWEALEEPFLDFYARLCSAGSRGRRPWSVPDR